MIQVLYPLFLLGMPVILVLAGWHWYYYKHPVYRFSSLVPFTQVKVPQYQRFIKLLLRTGTLLALCLALARVRQPDERTRIPVQGVDIMLVLDISGSMNIFDDLQDQRPRFAVAREEALRFIQRREHDPVGLVIFGGVALARSPLTLDKDMLKEILMQTDTDTIEEQGTVLSRAILTAANRLKKSDAKSKIMVVLTDGDPSEQDTPPHLSIDLAKKLGIKIYTVGIGSERGGWYNHPLYGTIQYPSSFNEPLLRLYAQETGGQFFHARNPADMKQIYATIDTLEKSEHEAPLYGHYYEYFMIFLWLAFFLLLLEIFLRTIVWVRL